MIVAYIDAHRHQHGVEPICRVLTEAGTQIAPSTYYAAKTRPPSARRVTDAAMTRVIERVHAENYGVYGIRKVHAELHRQGHSVARCTVARLMRAAGAAWDQPGEGSADHRRRHRPGHPAGPGAAVVHHHRTRPAVGR